MTTKRTRFERAGTACGVAVILAALGCERGASRDGAWNGTQRDSAGVTIVANREPGLWPADSALRVTEDLSVGAPSGSDEYVFNRIGDVAPDGRGGLLVLEQNPAGVRVFDGTGRFVRRIGGAGRGPGEMSAFVSDVLVGAGDSVVVPDYAQARINVFSPGGALARTIGIPATPGGRSWELLPVGAGFLLRGVAIRRDSTGQFAIWDGLLGLDPSGARLDTLIAFDYARTPLGGPGRLRVPLIVNNAFWCRLADGRIAWSSLDRESVAIHTPTGALATIIRHEAWRRPPLAGGDRARLVALLRTKLRLLGGDAAAADGPNVDAPERLPAITGLEAGPDSTLWVQRMGTIADVHPMAINAVDRSDWLGGRVWQVLDARGRYLGAVTMPPRFRVTRIARGAVYGVSRDSVDVERAVRLRLSRGRAR